MLLHVTGRPGGAHDARLRLHLTCDGRVQVVYSLFGAGYSMY